MDYLNKFSKFVQQKIPNIKNPFDKGGATNPYIQQGISSLNSNEVNVSAGLGNNIPSSQIDEKKPKSSSLSAFLNAEKKNVQFSPSSNSPNDVMSYNPFTVSYKHDSKPDEEFMKDFKLIKGESVIYWEKCEIRIEDKEYSCKAIITTYRLMLSPHFVNDSPYRSLFPEEYFSIPIHQISLCEKTIDKRQTFKYLIEIKSNDNREANLLFKVGQNEAFYFCLTGLIEAKGTSAYSSFALKFNMNNESKENGWDLYDPEKEFARQGLTNLDTAAGKGRLFRKTLLNESFDLCDTYPQFLITSGQIFDEDLKMASLYRTKNRLPSLSYYSNQSTGTVWRCSQNKSGMTGARNEYDEKICSILSTCGNNKKLSIYDARPFLSAYANKLKGAGFENIDNYIQAEIFFCDIDNIHAARNALNKVYTLLANPTFTENRNFFSAFESSKWPEFVYLLIKSSIKIALSVKQGSSTLIHCSDGWDRASQLTAFSQMLIDPYYRTLRGYMVLVEKDFLSFGHQFKYRNGYYNSKEFHEDQNSPIFLQYLDATHQLLIQYPMYFEFNNDFLVFVASNITSGKYGTFLFNHEKDRMAKEAKLRTRSIWTDVLENKEKYLNPYYSPKTINSYFFAPQIAFSKIRLWEEFFMQYSQIGMTVNYNQVIIRNLSKDNTRLLSNLQYYISEKKPNQIANDNQIIIQDKKEDTEKHSLLMKCLGELIEKSEIPTEHYESLSPEVKQMLNEIQEESLNGKMVTNSNGDRFVFVKNTTNE